SGGSGWLSSWRSTGPSRRTRRVYWRMSCSARVVRRGVRAAGTGPDGLVQVGGGGRGAVADLGDRGPDGAGDVEPGTFGFRTEAPGPAAEPGRGGELVDQEVLLGAQAAGPLGVGEFLVEGGEALPVGRPGPLVEDLVGPGSGRVVQPVFCCRGGRAGRSR